MWAKLVQTLLMPLIQKSVVALYKYVSASIKDWWRKRKLKKKNEGKVEDYENATNIDDARDAHNKLP